MYYNNKKLVLSIFWVILGAVLIWLSIAEVLETAYWSGMGGALIAVGVLQVIRNLRYRNDAEYQEKVNIEYGDERNKYLRMMSWAWTGYLVVLIEATGVVVALIMGQHTVQVILAYSVCMIVGIYWIVYMILKRKF